MPDGSSHPGAPERRRLYLIRHASPEIDARVPARQWCLSAQGRRDAEALGRRLSLDVARIWSSDEPKALETATILAAGPGAGTAVHADLREVAFASGILPQAEFRRRVQAYLDGADDPAFEPYEAARQRIMRCLAEICRTDDGDVAVVSHGRIITVLLSGMLGRRLGGRVWSRIGMPDVTLLDLESGDAVSGFAAGT